MKAIRVRQFGDPEVMVVEDVPDLTPGAGQVLVRIHAAGVNPVETYIRSGNYALKPALPYTPGTDGAGIVEAVGSGVTSVLPGNARLRRTRFRRHDRHLRASRPRSARRACIRCRIA